MNTLLKGSLRLCVHLPRIASSPALTPRCILLFSPVRNSGHSHWQNVRHTKEVKDKERSRITSVILLQLNVAIKAGGGCKDPNLNSKLASVIAEAKANNLSMDVINRRLNSTEITDPYLIEIQAPGGIFSIIQCRAKAVRPTRDKIQTVAKKYGFSVTKSSVGTIARDFFNQIGLLLVRRDSLADVDRATELAIEVGSNDVREVTLNDGDTYFEFECEPNDLDNVRQMLESHGVTVVNFDTPYIPRTCVEVTPANVALISEMYNRLRDSVDYIDAIYDNFTDEPALSATSSK